MIFNEIDVMSTPL